ncbi:dihydrouridine synthase [Kosmotoga arenicorallina S304]|uniref:tRNA-dihydrouridine synthase n=1 Tax=Kosmotoga arenicorallina S304 TaxID=1453497 RepID=A0A176K3X4_9BACT|nr:tRNA-dihydrouridine synthase family protein [Kosmotoga arenicorallina]OAA31731.1 dihydrouridine synthase [Kosmotoga arenicorallina S304]
MKKKFEIGLAPMAGYTDHIMRSISLKWGADFVFTEMLSVDGILLNDRATSKLLPKKPCRVQLFGNEPLKFLEAYKRIADLVTWIDINAGCPVKKVTRKGAGSALLQNPDRLVSIIKLLKENTDKPVSVKIRLGWNDNRVLDIVSKLITANPDAIFIHGRTTKQKYMGEADWEAISKAAKFCSEYEIPVFGSGDLFTPEAIKKIHDNYPVDGVIVARGAIGNPWIFKQSKELIEKETYEKITAFERLKAFAEHLSLLTEEKGFEKGIKESRKFFVGYTRGVNNAAKMRNEYMRLKTIEEIKNFLLCHGIDTARIKNLN